MIDKLVATIGLVAALNVFFCQAVFWTIMIRQIADLVDYEPIVARMDGAFEPLTTPFHAILPMPDGPKRQAYAYSALAFVILMAQMSLAGITKAAHGLLTQ